MGNSLVCDSRLARRLITYNLVPLVSGEPATHSQVVVQNASAKVWYILTGRTAPHKDSSPQLLVHFCC